MQVSSRSFHYEHFGEITSRASVQIVLPNVHFNRSFHIKLEEAPRATSSKPLQSGKPRTRTNVVTLQQ